MQSALPVAVSAKTAHHFAHERVSEAFCKEVLPLIICHFNETAHFKDIALKPDFEHYITLDQLGFVRLFTARELLGELIGYGVFFVRDNIHYQGSLQATQDLLYIKPSHRGFAFHFITYCDEQLADEGVEVIYQHVPTCNDYASRLLTPQGYEILEHVYVKRFS